MKKTTKRIIAVISTVSLILSCTVNAFAETEQEENISTELAVYEKIIGYIKEMYIDPDITEEEIMRRGLSKFLEGNKALMDQLLKATFAGMDSYSVYHTADEQPSVTTNNIAYGIGIYIRKSIDDDYTTVAGFSEENAPAQLAGIHTEDKIIKVDGTDVKGMAAEEVVSLIAGDADTEVTLTILRDDKIKDITITRTKSDKLIGTKSVMPISLDNNIGYIKITSFQTGTADEFRSATDSMKSSGVKKIILDLRNNPGGLVYSAVDIAKMIVPKGKIIDVKGRDESSNVSFYSELEKTDFDFIVLVNGGTASAAEILASAMQDSGAGILLGTQTYGKAVIQDRKQLDNGDFFYLTVAQYVTRNGHEINKVGLTPDKEIENGKKKIDTSKYLRFDYKTVWKLGNSGECVRAAKERLTMLNYYRGSVDDNFSSDLEDAVSKFQLNVGLYPYGVLDIATQIKLDEKFSEYEAVIDNQMQTAYEMFGGSAYSFD